MPHFSSALRPQVFSTFPKLRDQLKGKEIAPKGHKPRVQPAVVFCCSQNYWVLVKECNLSYHNRIYSKSYGVLIMVT